MNKYQTLLLLLILPLMLLQAGWEPLPSVPESLDAGGGIAYGGGYIWCVPGGGSDGFYAYDIADSTWIELEEELPDYIEGAGAIAYESGWNRRIFVAAKLDDEDQLFIYTRDSANTVEGEWNDEEIYLPNFEECGPGVSLAYQPVVKWYQPIQESGGWLYLLLGGGEKKFYRRWFPVIFSIPDTAVGPRGVSYDWEELHDIPDTVKAGGALCFNCYSYGDESESLFALVGGGKRNFYTYSPGQGRWTAEPQTELDQNVGSSITSGMVGKKLFAIFGTSEDTTTHYRYFVDERRWRYGHQLPAILSNGASITCNPSINYAYLVIGGERDNFYVNQYADEEEKGAQSLEVMPVSQKPKISSYQDRLIIHYSTDEPSWIRIQAYDLSGKQIKTLFTNKVEKGEHQITWNKTDNYNRKVTSGVYFITIVKGNRVERLKAIISK